jgi:hypothetical protein
MSFFSIEGNPAVSGSLALIAGNLLGSSVDKLTMVLAEKADITGSMSLSPSARAIVNSSIAILFEVGALGLGTQFVVNALPWIQSDPSAFTLWIAGIMISSDGLRHSLATLNEALWAPAIGGGKVIPPQ